MSCLWPQNTESVSGHQDQSTVSWLQYKPRSELPHPIWQILIFHLRLTPAAEPILIVSWIGLLSPTKSAYTEMQ